MCATCSSLDELSSWSFRCFFVSVFAVIIVVFDGFEDHLKFQWSFYEFVLGFFVVNSCCKLVSDNFFRCNAVEFAFSVNIHQSFPIFI